MLFIKLEKINKENNTISYEYTCSNKLNKYFNQEERFTIHYSYNIENIPDSIASLAFIGNVAPIAWLTNAELIIPQTDKSFYDNYEALKQAFANMYPNLKFEGKLTTTPIENNQQKPIGKPITLFSGGVDAWHTLIRHLDEKPILATFYGGDYKYSNKNGIDNSISTIKDIAKNLNLDSFYCIANLMQFISHDNLNIDFAKKLGLHWWHDIQCGVGAITLFAPIAYLNNSKTLYIASTHCESDGMVHKCSTNPSTDNNIHFSNCDIIHDSYDTIRQRKIDEICHFSKENNFPITLHVCWFNYDDNHNCCKCEKCLRTMMGVIAAGYNPNDFGLKYDKTTITDLLQETLVSHSLQDVVTSQFTWTSIFKAISEKKEVQKEYPELVPFLNTDFNHIALKRFIFRKKKKLKKIFCSHT